MAEAEDLSSPQATARLSVTQPWVGVRMRRLERGTGRGTGREPLSRVRCSARLTGVGAAAPRADLAAVDGARSQVDDFTEALRGLIALALRVPGRISPAARPLASYTRTALAERPTPTGAGSAPAARHVAHLSEVRHLERS